MGLFSKLKKAKFFCESCGSEVGKNDKVCTNCGKFFTSVRCPKCGNTGHSDEFVHGCPECGYAVRKTGSKLNKNKNDNYMPKILGLYSYSSATGTSIKTEAASEGSLPVWIYIVSVLALFGVIFGVYSCLN